MSNSAWKHCCFFRFRFFCSVFLSLAECRRLASVPYASWKGLRVLDRVAAELFSCKTAKLADVAVDTEVDGSTCAEE